MLEEKAVRRGEVWWVKSMDSFGQEYGSGRPAVVVSNDKGNEHNPTVIMAYVTTQKKHPYPVNVPVRVAGKLQTVMCNQLITPDKDRLERRICTLTESEMVRVGAALAVAVNITPSAKPEPEAQDDVAALRCERDMWQRMYEMTMEMLVELRVTAAVEQRTAVSAVEEPPVVVEDAVEKDKPLPEDKPLPVDINHCSALALQELGLSLADAESIIGCRPFESVLELNCVPDLDTKWVAANERRFVCTPIAAESEEPPTKVNLNTCTPADLRAIGMSKGMAYKVTSERKHGGPFASVEDLARGKYIGVKFVAMWADKLEV